MNMEHQEVYDLNSSWIFIKLFTVILDYNLELMYENYALGYFSDPTAFFNLIFWKGNKVLSKDKLYFMQSVKKSRKILQWH